MCAINSNMGLGGWLSIIGSNLCMPSLILCLRCSYRVNVSIIGGYCAYNSNTNTLRILQRIILSLNSWSS